MSDYQIRLTSMLVRGVIKVLHMRRNIWATTIIKPVSEKGSPGSRTVSATKWPVPACYYSDFHSKSSPPRHTLDTPDYTPFEAAPKMDLW